MSFLGASVLSCIKLQQDRAGGISLVLSRGSYASMLIGKLLGLHELRRDAWLCRKRPHHDWRMFASLFQQRKCYGQSPVKIRDDGTIQRVPWLAAPAVDFSCSAAASILLALVS